jgi:carbamoylphosphate synthase large subunit
VAGERLLLTGDESTGTLAALRALRAAGYRTWLAVSRNDTYAGRSRAAAGVLHVPDAKDEPEAHAQRVAREAKRLEIAAVLPGTEGSLRALTGREAHFGAIVVGTTDREALDRATDKGALERFATAAGLETPVTREVVDGAVPDDVTLPAVVKPVASVLDGGGRFETREVTRVTTDAELREALARGERWLVQPYVSGLLGAVCGVAWRGELVCASHQVSPRIWPVGRGISSYAVTVPRNADLEERVARLIEIVGWSGIFGVQFIHSAGRAYVIDLNPRIYGSTALAFAAGHNLPSIWADLLLGRDPHVGPYRVGVRYRVEEDDLRAIVAMRDWRGLVPRRNTVHGVFSVRDPAPTLVTLRKIVRGILG